MALALTRRLLTGSLVALLTTGLALAAAPAAPAGIEQDPPFALKPYADKVVSIQLPAKWRWLPQKPDPAESGGNYLPLSRFQGNNVLKEPASVTVNAFVNGQGKSVATWLPVLQKAFVPGGAKAKPIAARDGRPEGFSFESEQWGRPVVNYVFARSSDLYVFVLTISSFDRKLSQPLAHRIFRTLKVAM